MTLSQAYLEGRAAGLYARGIRDAQAHAQRSLAAAESTLARMLHAPQSTIFAPYLNGYADGVELTRHQLETLLAQVETSD